MDWPCWEMDEEPIMSDAIHPKPTEFSDDEVAADNILRFLGEADACFSRARLFRNKARAA